MASDKDAVDVEVGKDDSIWYWTSSGQVKRRVGNSWKVVSGIPKVKNMAVLNEHEYYIIDTSGRIQKFTSGSKNGLNLPGCVGVQEEGKSYCVNPDIKSNTVK